MIIRSESRTVRPFSGLSLAEDIFSRTTLCLDSNEYEQGSLLLPVSQVRNSSLKVNTKTTLEEIRKACDAAQVPYKSARYVIYARSRMLRRSTIIYEHSISRNEFEEEIAIDRLLGDRLVFGDQSGYEISMALILWEQLTFKTLQVTEPGTWLGRSRFRIRPENDFSSFSPLPLDKVTRDSLGLRPGTYSFIDIQEDLLTLEDLSDGVIVYLDEDVLNLLLTDESDSMAKAIQTQLAVNTISTIAQYIGNELKADGSTIGELGEDVGASRFVYKLASNCKIDSNELMEMAVKNSNHLVSLIESQFNLANLVEHLLKDN